MYAFEDKADIAATAPAYEYAPLVASLSPKRKF